MGAAALTFRNSSFVAGACRWNRKRLPALSRSGRCKHRRQEARKREGDRWRNCTQVASFAHAYNYKLRDTTPNAQENLNIEYVHLPKAVNWFLDWPERQSSGSAWRVACPT